MESSLRYAALPTAYTPRAARDALTHVAAVVTLAAVISLAGGEAGATQEKQGAYTHLAKKENPRRDTLPHALLPAEGRRILHHYRENYPVLRPRHLAVLLANIAEESRFNPQAKDKCFYGLVQWSCARTGLLKRYAAARKKTTGMPSRKPVTS